MVVLSRRPLNPLAIGGAVDQRGLSSVEEAMCSAGANLASAACCLRRHGWALPRLPLRAGELLPLSWAAELSHPSPQRLLGRVLRRLLDRRGEGEGLRLELQGTCVADGEGVVGLVVSAALIFTWACVILGDVEALGLAGAAVLKLVVGSTALRRPGTLS